MKRITAVFCLAVLMMSLFSAEAEREISTGMRIYGEGSYAVGTNFEAGEYFLFSAEGQEASFLVSIDEEGLDVITEGAFITNTVLTVEADDYLFLTGCTAVLAADYHSVNKMEPDQYGGTLMVGADLEPGRYELVGSPDTVSSYRVYDDSRFHIVSEEGQFQLVREVTVSRGQYLELVGCTVGIRLSRQGTETQPEASPAPEAQATPQPTGNRRQGIVLSTATPKPTAVPTPAPTAKPKPTAAPTAAPTQKPAPAATAQATSEPDAKQTAPTEGPEDEQDDAMQTVTPAPEPEPVRKVRIDHKRTPVVRSLPSTKGEKFGTAEAGAEYELLETEDKWYKIRLDDGTEGWITSSMAEIIE